MKEHVQIESNTEEIGPLSHEKTNAAGPLSQDMTFDDGPLSHDMANDAKGPLPSGMSADLPHEEKSDQFTDPIRSSLPSWDSIYSRTYADGQNAMQPRRINVELLRKKLHGLVLTAFDPYPPGYT